MSRMFREDINDDHVAALTQNITKHGGAVKGVALVEGLREVMQRQTTVTFSDFLSSAGGMEGYHKRERYSNLDRMGSIKSILSGIYRPDSDDSGGEDIRRKYKDMVPPPNRRWGAQIFEKRQRECRPAGTFNGEDETAKAITAFKLGGFDAITELNPQLEARRHLETRLLSVQSKGKIEDILISKHDCELAGEPGHSKNIDRPHCSETDQEKEENHFKGSERIYNPEGGKDDEKASSWRREHMFEKTVTPSDVGKLNRLVIPKQHAKKYFPLDTDANEKGLLLNFEDSAGKAWRFRYSYWNSSQSYVFTKGWSRFVKEKKLDEGDIVSFDRAAHQDPNLQRLFISCKRRPCNMALFPGLPGFVKRPLQFRSPFQFPYDAIYNIGGSHGQQLVTSRALIGQQWSPLFWPANNVGGESSRSAAETKNMQTNAKPMDLLTSLHFIRSDDCKPIKGIHDSAVPFSVRSSSNTTECRRFADDTESSVKTPPLRDMQHKAPGNSPDDLSAATSFDLSTSASSSKKVVRLFGVNLECGKFNDNYEDELLLIRPAEPLFS